MTVNLISRVNHWRVSYRQGLGPLLLHSKGVGGEVLVCRSGRASVAVGTAATAGTMVVVVDAVATTGATTAIDVAAVDETAVPTGTTMALGVAAYQTRRTSLFQPRWRT